MKTNINKELEVITQVIKSNRFIKDRINKLQSLGFEIQYKAMGNGGILQVKNCRNHKTAIQIGYGKSRYNYAYVAMI